MGQNGKRWPLMQAFRRWLPCHNVIVSRYLPEAQCFDDAGTEEVKREDTMEEGGRKESIKERKSEEGQKEGIKEGKRSYCWTNLLNWSIF